MKKNFILPFFLTRYQGEIGDIVVGRITEVSQKLWKVDINGKQDALLMLSAVNLPGGVLVYIFFFFFFEIFTLFIKRRRTTSDELQMRSIYVENDLISVILFL